MNPLSGISIFNIQFELKKVPFFLKNLILICFCVFAFITSIAQGTNTIKLGDGFNGTICDGLPHDLVEDDKSKGNITYSWEKSTTGASGAFVAIPNTDSKDYTINSLPQTTWFRRKMIAKSGSSNYSNVLQVNLGTSPSASGMSTFTCVGGSSGTISVNASGGLQPYLYSINGGTYQSSNLFSGLAANSYSIGVKSNEGCVGNTIVTVDPYPNSTDDQNASATNSWKGHMYAGINFDNYKGNFTEAETFDESFGGQLNCFSLASGTGNSFVYTENFSARFRMNSTKKGLYVVDLGSDDGSRLTIDNNLVYNNWIDQSWSVRPNVLINLTGSSTLNYEFYEKNEVNRVLFQNLTLILSNNLTGNTSQGICMGNVGQSISGDNYGTLPAGISLSGTGFQWSYSSSPTGTRVNITGATGSTFTPNTNSAPFNTSGTYYLYRNAKLTSTNNTGMGTFSISNESNAAIVTVSDVSLGGTLAPSATVCAANNNGIVSLSGQRGNVLYWQITTDGVNWSTIANTGTTQPYTNLTQTTTGRAVIQNGVCPVVNSGSATITVTPVPSATISYSGSPFCTSGAASVTTSGTGGGMYTSTPGLSINSSTGAINLAASTVGNYTVTYTVPASGGCSLFSTSTNISIISQGTWKGSLNSDWNNSGNWACGVIPTSVTNVLIPQGVPYYPVLNSGTGLSNNITVKNGASVTISATGKLQIFGSIVNDGIFDVSDGTLEMKGANPQLIAGSMFKGRSIKNLAVSNTGTGLSLSAIANDTLKITGILSFGNTNSKLNTGNNLTLISNSLGTASLGKVGANNTITGNATVERYINTGTATGQHFKSWQFLSTSTTGQSFKQSWMENGNNISGYGIQTSGPQGISGGFDVPSPLPSIKYYDYNTNAWVGISSAYNPVFDPRGYMVFVRGDRTVDGITKVTPTPTILRTTGALITGSLPVITVPANKFQTLGNPYPSAIDFTLITKSAGINDLFYVWDPYLNGSYGLGGYQTFSAVNGWEPIPGGTYPYPSGSSSSLIQSGQAFFIFNGDPVNAATIEFTENCKTSAIPTKNFAREFGEDHAGRGFLKVNLFTAPAPLGMIADGNVVAFDKVFSNEIDGDDASKMNNSGENFGLRRGKSLLSVEAKSTLRPGDTIFYQMSNLRRQVYQLRFMPLNMASAGMDAFLVDNFLGNLTPVSLADTTYVNISVTPDPASSASDRFKVVFRPATTLPVNISSVKAYAKENKVIVSWHTENESGIKNYQIERSGDGNYFVSQGSVDAKNLQSYQYVWKDTHPLLGNNYYRIKIIDKDGNIKYSITVRVWIDAPSGYVSVFPNPISDGMINIRFDHQPKGIYNLKLLNSSGQIILKKDIKLSGENQTTTLHYPGLAKGVYQLMIIGLNGEIKNIKIIN